MLDLQQMYAVWKQITNTNTKTLAFYQVLARGLIKHTAPTEFESPVSHPNVRSCQSIYKASSSAPYRFNSCLRRQNYGSVSNLKVLQITQFRAFSSKTNSVQRCTCSFYSSTSQLRSSSSSSTELRRFRRSSTLLTELDRWLAPFFSS